MSWQDRIKPAAYTSPSGQRLEFMYEDVARDFSKKTTAFDFPDADGTYVQDLGVTGRRYPLRIFFSGDNYDQDAEVFEGMLSERGNGRLEHPMYGIVDVVPFGTISRVDALKTAANQAVLQVVFFETIGLVYPTSQEDPQGEVLTALNDFNESTALQVGDDLDLESAGSTVLFRNDYQLFLDKAKSDLQSIADTQDDVRSSFNTIYDSINRGIETLVGQPANLAFQTALFPQEAARAVTSITDRLSAYGDLITSTISTFTGSNDFHTRRLFAFSYVSAQALAVINNRFDTKPEALTAAETILDSLETVVDWADDGYGTLEQVDTGEAYQQLQNLVALTAGFLVEISFSLKQEKRITIDRDRTIIDLAAELYGEVDSQLDFLINSNNLTGSEILELPRGREIVYFI